jgi:mannose-6-phosphate isomerase-like protein (cupin superfamily)
MEVPEAASVTPIETIRRSPRAALFEGGDRAPISMFVTTYAHGEGPSLHLHPYPEVFLVETGTARFTVGEDELVVEAGNVVTVAAETPHGFKNAGEGTLNIVSIHPSPAVRQTDLA